MAQWQVLSRRRHETAADVEGGLNQRWREVPGLFCKFATSWRPEFNTSRT
jgi:hypothetical protein